MLFIGYINHGVSSHQSISSTSLNINWNNWIIKNDLLFFVDIGKLTRFSIQSTILINVAINKFDFKYSKMNFDLIPVFIFLQILQMAMPGNSLHMIFIWLYLIHSNDIAVYPIDVLYQCQ